MKIAKYITLFFISFSLACSSQSQKTKETKDSLAISSEQGEKGTPVFENNKQQAVFTAYNALKNDLVQSKFDDAKKAAVLLANQLKNYDGCENTAVTANKIANARDIAVQRKAFTSLNTDLIALFKHADLTKGTIYVQHCPMANNGDGGDWLSVEKKIQNPYYGKAMMECGAVVEEIKAD